MNLLKSLFTLLAMFALWHPAQAAVQASAPTAEVVAEGLQFPEGTVFVGDDLYFVDYGASSVYRLHEGRTATVWHEAGCGANGLLPLAGHLLVACYDSGRIQSITLDGRLIHTATQDAGGARFVHPNDLAAAQGAGAYFTASGGDGNVPGKVFHMADESAPPREVATAIQNANGIVLSPDGRWLYVGESTTDKVLLFDAAPDGTLSNRRDFLSLDTVLGGDGNARHTPDGIRIDSQGRLFVSLYNGGGFAVFDAAGGLLARVSIPGKHHANLALSADGSLVFGTTVQDDAGSGPAGSLYRVANPIQGPAAPAAKKPQ